MKQLLILLSVAVVGLTGCATVGEIPVDVAGDEPVYISPANADGVQDSVSLPISVVPLDRTRLTSYAVLVSDTRGTVVRSAEERIERRGLFARFRRQSVEPPAVLLWDGRDQAGRLVPDGEYLLSVTVSDNRGNTGSGPERRVIVDNTPPRADVALAFPVFTPNGDGILDTLTIFQRDASPEDRWAGAVVDESGRTVRSFTWAGIPPDAVWDGTRDDRSAAPEGSYSYVLTSTDRAGNSASFRVDGIVLERQPRSVRLDVDLRAFSPNGDGVQDVVTLRPSAVVRDNVTGWRIEIRDVRGRTVRTFAGTTLPESVVFDGADERGTVLPDGQYRAVLTVSYAGGQRPETASPIITLNTQPPRATVSVARTRFSPDGDGRRDTVEVFQSGTADVAWVGRLTNQAGATVLTERWEDELRSFVWDGTDATGRILPDGTYTYVLSSTDPAGNAGASRPVRIVLDTRPTPIAIAVDRTRFSPNGDGLEDIVRVALSASIPDGIESWRVSVVTAADRNLGVIATGAGDLPAGIDWDGSAAGVPLADGQYALELYIEYEKGNVSTALSPFVRVDTEGPTIALRTQPALFSPDDDGVDDTLTITLGIRDPSPILRWDATVYDPQGARFIGWAGTGTPPATIRWNGLSDTGELVQSAEDYRLVVNAVDAVYNASVADTVIPIDILVIREGDRLRIRISSIYFVPFTADYTNLEPDQAARNLQTLDRLAVVLAKYPQHSISVEGHAVSLLWYDRVRAAREQEEVLLPLSIARAEAIRTALAQRGVAATRMRTTGYGGSIPVVPHSDEANRWKNRRVEFVLQRR
ncbi:MAG: hypothetical protein EA382_12785 [Spirochaetaceae bacterium]|nr:MAG: hypothetical protein EA382_12785 [Spirochaetaceae bacterium]